MSWGLDQWRNSARRLQSATRLFGPIVRLKRLRGGYRRNPRKIGSNLIRGNVFRHNAAAALHELDVEPWGGCSSPKCHRVSPPRRAAYTAAAQGEVVAQTAEVHSGKTSAEGSEDYAEARLVDNGYGDSPIACACGSDPGLLYSNSRFPSSLTPYTLVEETFAQMMSSDGTMRGRELPNGDVKEVADWCGNSGSLRNNRLQKWKLRAGGCAVGDFHVAVGGKGRLGVRCIYENALKGLETRMGGRKRIEVFAAQLVV